MTRSRVGAPRPRGPLRHRTAAGCGAERRRHAAPLLPVRTPRPHVVIGGRADPASGRRAHDPPDRAGVPGARGDDGAAHQPGQAHRRPRRSRSPRRRAHGDAGALPRLQRGLLRRRRPCGGSDPPDPAAGRAHRRPRGARPARADVAAPRAPTQPHPTRREHRAPRRAGPQRSGTPRSSPKASTSPRRRWHATSLGEYQAQAAIAALHADAPRVEETDWVQIVEWYDELLRFADTPIVRLNRAVAVGEADGAPAGLAALAEVDDSRPAARRGRRVSAREERRPRAGRPPLRRRVPQRAQPRGARPPDAASGAAQRPAAVRHLTASGLRGVPTPWATLSTGAQSRNS